MNKRLPLIKPVPFFKSQNIPMKFISMKYNIKHTRSVTLSYGVLIFHVYSEKINGFKQLLFLCRIWNWMPETAKIPKPYNLYFS